MLSHFERASKGERERRRDFVGLVNERPCIGSDGCFGWLVSLFLNLKLCVLMLVFVTTHDMAQASKKEAYLAKDDSDDEIEEVHFLSVNAFFSI